MTREEICELPIRRYEGPVEVLQAPAEMAKAVEDLKREDLLGFDTETRPSFRRGESYLPSLVQLTGSDKTYLFQLGDGKLPRSLRGLLADGDIVKAGVAPAHDLRMLMHLASFQPAGIIDLGEVARSAGIKNHGLRGLAAVLLGFRISKSAQVSNWARAELLPAQVTYAATDSWVSRELYLCLRARGVEMKPDGVREEG